MKTSTMDEHSLDKEWFELILHAFQLGIPIGEIRDFLKKTSNQRF
ncbi:anti-repressor SinI family protein [Metabacillus halosaccharovorans]